MLSVNSQKFQAQFQRALSDANRPKDSVKVLLATKTVTPERLQEALQLGYCYFGENRVQELKSKQEILSSHNITWDFIGHLQTNKVKEVVGAVDLIHSVDRLSLAEAIQKKAQEKKIRQKILIEINTSGESSKSGVSLIEWRLLAKTLLQFQNIQICGLMTIAEHTKNENSIRECFRKLNQIRGDLAQDMQVKESSLDLSMGMSGDFSLAIQEGATIIRVGSALFGSRL